MKQLFRYPHLLVLFICMIVVLTAAGCRRPPDPRPADTIVIGALSDIQSWNPYLCETKFSEDVLALVYPSLMIENTDYRQHPPSFSPALAESWEFSSDHLLLDFHLRPDARWSDGEPMDSRDVVFTWEVQRNPELGWYGSYTKDFILSVTAIDPHTVRFRFDHAYPYQLMDANEGLILPAHAWKDIPFSRWDSMSWLQRVQAGGPYMPDAYIAQQEIRLKKNENYSLASIAEISRVIWRIIPEQTGLISLLRAGELDFINTVPPEDAETVRSDPRYRLVDYPDRGYTHICWNMRKEVFGDRGVRLALAKAIDRRKIIATVYRGYATPSRGPILSTMWAFDPGLAAVEYAPAEARKLLESRGWRDSDGDGILDRNGHPFEFELLSNAENRMRQDIALLVAEDLRSIGVRVVPRSLEWGSFLKKLQKGDFDAAVNRWIEPTQIDLEDLWHSHPEGEASSNYGAYSNPEVDRLIDEAAAESDFRKQAPLYHRIQQLIVHDQPYVFLVESRRLNAIHHRISGAILNDATPYFNLEAWHLKEEAD